MKVNKINIDDLVFALQQFIDKDIQYVDIEILESKNIIRFSTSLFEDKQEIDIA